jgi:hypothetical protein
MATATSKFATDLAEQQRTLSIQFERDVAAAVQAVATEHEALAAEQVASAVAPREVRGGFKTAERGGRRLCWRWYRCWVLLLLVVVMVAAVLITTA